MRNNNPVENELNAIRADFYERHDPLVEFIDYFFIPGDAGDIFVTFVYISIGQFITLKCVSQLPLICPAKYQLQYFCLQ